MGWRKCKSHNPYTGHMLLNDVDNYIAGSRDKTVAETLMYICVTFRYGSLRKNPHWTQHIKQSLFDSFIIQRSFQKQTHQIMRYSCITFISKIFLFAFQNVIIVSNFKTAFKSVCSRYECFYVSHLYLCSDFVNKDFYT